MILTHQTVFVLGLAVNHPHVLNPDTDGRHVDYTPTQAPPLPRSGASSHLVFTMSTGIDAAVVTRPLIMLAQK